MQVLDLSEEVGNLALNLQQAVGSSETDPTSPCDVDTSVVTQANAEESIFDMLISEEKR